MSILLGEVGVRPRNRNRKRGRKEQASIREVCLLGASGPGAGPGWASGERVKVSGRDYRVASAQEQGQGLGVDESAPRYVHLAVEG
jgi:hypothetical protein